MSEKRRTFLEISLLTKIDNLLRKAPKTRKELIRILKKTAKDTALSKETIGMIENLLTFSDRYVDDVMIPRPQMVVIDSSASLKTVLPIVRQSRHSRFPVVSHNRDKVVGILLAKDLLQFSLKPTDENILITSLIRPAIFIPKSKRLNTLLKEFRLNHYHMAIVVDEYGGVDGLVTIEDVLEEIVGNIEDEYDNIEQDVFIKPLKNQEFLVNSLTPIEDFNHYFKTDFDTAEYDTIGGLIIQHLNRLPVKNEVFEYESFQITILKADSRRIHLFKFKRKSS